MSELANSAKVTERQEWPDLPLEAWQSTYATLHRWTQIVGKTRLALSPFQNHWWHCALYVMPRGLTTGGMPAGNGTIEVEFDFLDATLTARTSTGALDRLRLENKSVAAFYSEYLAMLGRLGVDVRLHAAPNELPDATPFLEDYAHATYAAEPVRRWWRSLARADRALKEFRGQFVGKCSPSHFWWGAFDLSCTRFSGRRAPPHPGGIPNCPGYVMTEAYSHECISAGWWPGTAGSPVAEPAFYAYAYPEPAGCSDAPISPPEAFYQREMREWILPYTAVRAAPDPHRMIMEFLESTYEAAASRGQWDTAALRSSYRELPPIQPRS